ncbi:DUF2487 family protein [Paenibacillus pasadenensis]|uniref:DUF2487 family protein n=1 Tax=Paenibacillus pasadenensis TaxID=217090 RepID=UPI00203A652A|nr:DUF2487 family protein [Paenibacillus pasadenensis]MCM3747488.1 DUF2487 family protein [Paenibacillus pasadenensis]
MMKFSEIDAERWPELQPFMDTCLLPVTGLSGLENPWQAAAVLERLRDAMDAVEIPFKGRIVAYPAVQYGDEQSAAALGPLVRKLRQAGFRYVVAVSAALQLEALEEADLVLSPDGDGRMPDAAEVRERIRMLWNA